jgi:tol-pal system protein YbgF
MALSAFATLVGCACSTGCATAPATGGRDLALIRDELAQIRRQHDALARRLEAIERRDDGGSAAAPTTTEAKGVESRPLRVVRLAPEPPPSPSGSDGAEPSPPSDEPIPIVTGSAATKLDPGAATDYEAAFALVRAKKYEAALEAFAGFLVRNPDHPYAGHALYWRGDCHYAIGRYDAAIEQYEALLARFPASPKAADGLLKLGLSHGKLGRKERARAAYDRLRSEYPSAQAVKKIPSKEAS